MTRYNHIGTNYDVTRKADPFLAKTLFELLNPSPEKVYLDIGCGTGNYTTALHQMGVNFIGVDPSEKMISEAKQKSSSIDWKIGTAEDIPLKDDSVDGVFATLTLHHWSDLKKGLSEVGRVIRPKGNTVIFTSYPEQTAAYWLKHYFPQMIANSAKTLPERSSILNAATESGFKLVQEQSYNVSPDLQDLFLNSGKHNPELYFNEGVRRGISSFALAQNQDEVESGLHRLRADIDNGDFDRIRKSYENEIGDYCFIKLIKD
ncbi:class I SAM-dependent methyltransferase [Phaeocystidibacter luteus]|uniref:Class I SAM-dependent methyltransferase n=1 Tax=Phaeocystidibacter luteus TaxID=911197 RepID=A0A6N6RGH7_9FLAO|nr:class I SAM-dependent methyltransferase [Phaeocystidibacter luteus]KAB2807740.1 class I SAM-dependent methyltransferase [Phaeocystidibacter luteus]